MNMMPRQTVWPSFPLTLPYQVMVGTWPSYMPGDYPALAMPTQTLPCNFSTVIENPGHSRKVFLKRSVFDLVCKNVYLDLTDPKLLGWYLSLSPGDRKIIQDEGGLHPFLKKHPSLELSRHHVYVKNVLRSNFPAQPSVTSVKHKAQMPGLKKCRCDHESGWENPTLLGCSSNHGYYPQDSFSSAYSSPVTPTAGLQRAPQQSELSWEIAGSSSSAAVSKDPGSLVSFSLDIELERCRMRGNPALTPVVQGQNTNIPYAEVSPLKSEQSAVAKELSSSEYCTFDRMQLDGTDCNDNSIIQFMEYKDEPISSLNEETDKFHSIIQNDKSIVLCLAQDSPNTHTSGGHSEQGATKSGTPLTCKIDQSPIQKSTAEKFTSPMPLVSACDVMVGTELTICLSAFTQTEDPARADKHIITEVHMSDLDYLAGEFIKLKAAGEELQKDKTKSSGCKLRKKCDCIQRAQQAELSLLALQYSLCRQHCLKLYYTFAEGDQLTPVQRGIDQYWPKSPPANIVSVLKKLETDYNQMREKILAGIPLSELKPLSVDCEKIRTGASYIPAQIIGDVLGDCPSWSSQQPQNNKPTGGPGCLHGQNSKDCQDSQIKVNQLKKGISRTKGAATLIPNDRDTNHSTHKPEEKQSTSPFKDLNTSEDWYDAEEDLEPAVAAETGKNSTVTAKHIKGSVSDEKAMSSVLCVSGLPSSVTEVDVMLRFEKYHVSDVHISTLKNNLRVAIMMVSSLQSAEAAVRELSGCKMHDHTLLVEHINRARAEDQGQDQALTPISGPDSSLDTPTQHVGIMNSSSTEAKVITQLPLSSSLKQRKVVCISPTAKGTCVPQHYGTMGSFDILMAELTQRHPDVGRQRIVDALLELRVKHQGVLSGLPLRTIREMTSDLLTRPASTT